MPYIIDGIINVLLLLIYQAGGGTPVVGTRGTNAAFLERPVVVQQVALRRR